MEKIVESRKLKHKALESQVRAERKKLKKMPTIAITDLDPSEIPHHFSLTHCLPTEFELPPSKTEQTSLPPHLGKFDYRYEYVFTLTCIDSILADYDMATGGSPTNEALIRSRIDVIILTALVKMKREFLSKPRTSFTSSASLKSVHLQFEREIKFVWKSGKRRVRLAGIVDYSLWYGMPNDYAINMAMVEATQPHLIKQGVFQCLAYMGK